MEERLGASQAAKGVGGQRASDNGAGNWIVVRQSDRQNLTSDGSDELDR